METFELLNVRQGKEIAKLVVSTTDMRACSSMVKEWVRDYTGGSSSFEVAKSGTCELINDNPSEILASFVDDGIVITEFNTIRKIVKRDENF